MQRSLLIRFLDLLLYGNFWIALCATAMALQTQYILTGQLSVEPVLLLIFFATLFLYGLHRIIGLQRVQRFTDRGRYLIIQLYRRHIWMYAGVGGLLAVGVFFCLRWQTQALLVLPAILSLGYVLPIFGKQRRLRDFHFIKIFLIALVWSGVTVVLPGLELFYWKSTPLFILLLERCCFILAITLPFDIRDLQVDAHTHVRTLPAVLGIRGSQWLGLLALLLMLGLGAFNWWLSVYSTAMWLALALSALLAGCGLWLAPKVQNDYFFTGLVDGLMVIQCLLIVGAGVFL